MITTEKAVKSRSAGSDGFTTLTPLPIVKETEEQETGPGHKKRKSKHARRKKRRTNTGKSPKGPSPREGTRKSDPAIGSDISDMLTVLQQLQFTMNPGDGSPGGNRMDALGTLEDLKERERIKMRKLKEDMDAKKKVKDKGEEKKERKRQSSMQDILRMRSGSGMNIAGELSDEEDESLCIAPNCDSKPVTWEGYCAHHKIKKPTRDASYSLYFTEVQNPKDAKMDKRLRTVFNRFSGHTGLIDMRRWNSMCKELGLVDGVKVRPLDVQLIYNLVKPQHGKFLLFPHVCKGFGQLAAKRYPKKGPKALRYMVKYDLPKK